MFLELAQLFYGARLIDPRRRAHEIISTYHHAVCGAARVVRQALAALSESATRRLQEEVAMGATAFHALVS